MTRWMGRPAAVVFACALYTLHAAAAEQWLKVTSTHFELYTTAGEKKGREALLYFEQVRDFFGKIRAGKIAMPNTPVRIIAFRSEKEFAPYRVNDSAIAFYLDGYDRDYIVMRGITDENYPVAIHEYTHLLIKHANFDPPIWLNEGLAELYSTLKPMGKKVSVGTVDANKYYFLKQNKWLPLDTLLAVDRQSPYYNERARTGIFYAESWALTHMLVLAPEYRPHLDKFLELVGTGLPAGNALWQVYAKTTAQVQKDLELYMRGTRFNAVLFDVKLEKSAEEPEIAPAAAVESGKVLADVLAFTDKKEAAKQAYEALIKDFPKNWEPEAGLAELDWRMQKAEQAREHFARAAELGATDPRIYFDYSMVLRDLRDNSAAITALKKSLALDGGNQDAHRYLAHWLVDDHAYQEAVDQFRLVKSVKTDQAFSYYHGLAYAYFQLQKLDDAQKAGEGAKKFAHGLQETAAADDLLRAVAAERERLAALTRKPSQPAPVQTAAKAANQSQAVFDDRPTLRRYEKPEEPKKLIARTETPPPPKPSVQGMLQQVDCLGKVVRLRVVAEGKRVALAITDPEAVEIKGAAPTATLDLTCGPQKPKMVTMEYEPYADPLHGTIGIVKSIEFH